MEITQQFIRTGLTDAVRIDAIQEVYIGDNNTSRLVISTNTTEFNTDFDSPEEARAAFERVFNYLTIAESL